MALYKYLQYLGQSNHETFDLLHAPGTPVPHSGIYRCDNCGDEIAVNQGTPFPPQDHHQHTPSLPIRWRLLVFSVSR